MMHRKKTRRLVVRSGLVPAGLGLVLLFFLVSGCGASLSYTVDEDLVRRLPKSSRRSVFQAETVVTIAVDRLSGTQRKIDSTRREIERTEEKIKEARKEARSASAREAEKIDLLIDMLKARADYLEDVEDHLRFVLKLNRRELLLAKGQFELAKVKLVKKHSIAFSGDEQDFVKQVVSIQEDVDHLRQKVEKAEAELKTREQEWLAVKKRYYSSVGESSRGWWTE